MAQPFDLSLAALTALILEAVEREAPQDGLQPDEPLFGDGSRLQLDSIDALQISMAIQKQYGIRMPDSKETRRALASLKTLSAHLAARADQ